MAQYIISILLTVILLSVVNLCSKKKAGFLYYLSSGIAILPPAIVAAVRDYTIGTDIRHYVTTNFGAALGFSHLFDYTNYISSISGDYIDAVNNTEFGYNVLVYAISRFTESPHWLLFFLQFLTSAFLLLGVYNIQKKIALSPVLAMLTYYLTLYPFTLNIMRQSLAAAITFFALTLLMDDKKKLYLCFQLLAMSFHGSAIMGVMLAVIYLVMRKKLFTNGWMLVYGILALWGTVSFAKNVFMMIQVIASGVPFLGGFATSFDVTTAYDSIKGILVYIFPDMVFTLLVSVGAWLAGTSDVKKEAKLNAFLNCLIILSIVFNSLYMVQTVIPRLAIYMMMFRIIAYPLMIKRQLPYLKIPMTLILVSAEIVTFVVILISKNGEVFPYTSQILDQFLFHYF